MPLVMGVDSSTQSTKVEVRDADTGELVASARAAHPSTSPPRSEQDPQSWWRALAGAISQIDRRDIAAISVAGQQHGLVPLDGDRKVIRPAKLWNDTESAPQARSLVEELGAEAWAESCGTVPVASLTITKVAWLIENEPEAAARLRHLLLPHDWLTMRLSGELVTDRGDASGTGYWSPFRNEWETRLLEILDPSIQWDARLPRVLNAGEFAGELTPDAAEEIGLPPGALVASGTGDNMAAALGLGLAKGDVAVSVGTSGTVFAVSEAPVADSTGAVAGFADAAGGYLPLVCTLNATKVTDAFARILGVEPDWLGRMALATEPGARGVVLVPYLDGERTPNLPDASGTLAGLRSDTTAEQIARAAFEGVVCGLLDALDALGAAGVETNAGRLVLTGGGARSDAYQRIFAEFSGRSISVAGPGEHVAAGAALQAAATLAGVPAGELSSSWDLTTAKIVEASPIDAESIRRMRLGAGVGVGLGSL